MNKQRGETDYRGFFIFGICLVVLGISLMSAIGSVFLSFIGCEVVFMVFGLANRDEWARFNK